MSPRDHLARLLFIVPYVASRDGVPIGELAEKLGVSTKQITSDLDLLCMVGQPPLTPDHLIDIYVEDEVVYVELDQSLSRPPSLTHEEAGALVLAARLLGHQGTVDAQLEGVLTKVISLLNPVDREMVSALAQRVGIWQDTPTAPQETLRRAIDERLTVGLEYYSASSDRAKHYTIEPLALVTHSGLLYLVGLDTEAERHEKLFRLDRMGEVTLNRLHFAAATTVDLEKYRRDSLYASGSDDFTAHVRFSAKVATRAAERFPKDDCKFHRDGSLVVRLSTSSPTFLAHWVLPFGTDAEVLAPKTARDALARLCAEATRVYGATEEG